MSIRVFLFASCDKGTFLVSAQRLDSMHKYTSMSPFPYLALLCYILEEM